MDMEFAHIGGYHACLLDVADSETWQHQALDMVMFTELNLLRLFPLFSYDPRRYRYAENIQSGTMAIGCGTWKEPFAQIVGSNDCVDGIKKIWLGFCMDTVLGFRPFDEYCEYLPLFYGKCEAESIPILARCAPGGITAHDAKTYKEFDKNKKNERANESKKRQERWWPNEGNTSFNSSTYHGQERIFKDENLNHFYQNYGHPKNWEIVLKGFPNLRLCLAGFGGNKMWSHKFMKSWETIDLNYLATIQGGEWIHSIIMLTRKANVYTDISGLDINNQDIRRVLKKILLLAFVNDNDYKHLKNRIIFSTGWYITLSKTHSHNKYCNDFKELIEDVEKNVGNNNGELKPGWIWEQISLINPWNFFGFSSRKIEEMSIELSKEPRGNVCKETLVEMINEFYGSKEKEGLVKYIAKCRGYDEERGTVQEQLREINANSANEAAVNGFKYIRPISEKYDIEHSVAICYRNGTYRLSDLVGGTSIAVDAKEPTESEGTLVGFIHTHILSNAKCFSGLDYLEAFNRRVPVYLMHIDDENTIAKAIPPFRRLDRHHPEVRELFPHNNELLDDNHNQTILKKLEEYAMERGLVQNVGVERALKFRAADNVFLTDILTKQQGNTIWPIRYIRVKDNIRRNP